MNKTLLVVGAGLGQVSAIKTAKQMGLTVVAIDKNINAVGMQLCDYAYDADVADMDTALAIAKKHRIDGVMTMQSDLPVPTVGYINDQLGLHGVSYEVAIACSNKMETRKKLQNKSSAQPKFAIVATLEEAHDAAQAIGFPCVIKAPDSSGSRGVTKVSTRNEIEAAFNEAFKYSREKEILVEEFIEGLEFGAQTFSVNGTCACVLLHGDTMSQPPYMIPIGHSFPFELLHETERAQAVQDINDAVNALGIQNGPANVDLILDKNTNRVKVIEIGARIGATCLPELVYYHTGIDWVKNTLLNAMGEEVDLQLRYEKPVAALIIEAPADGVYTGIELPEEGLAQEVIEFEITANIGEEINILRKGTDRIGKIIAYGNSAKDAEKIVDKCRNNIRILLE